MEKYKEIIRQKIKEKEFALIIGNGINRYNSKQSCSWKDVLGELYKEFGLTKNKSNSEFDEIEKEMSFIELYDMMCINAQKNTNDSKEYYQVREYLIDLISKLIEEKEIHQHWQQFALRNDLPILTTNFDSNLEKNLKEYRLFTPKKSDLRKKASGAYPWDVYYATKKFHKSSSPRENFGVWHINGMLKRKSSIRMGLANYMGSVEHAREMINRKWNSLYKTNSKENNWAGSNTWLDIFFFNSLYIFGLSLDKNETFLRWLLIERKKFHDIRGIKTNDFYVYCEKDDNKPLSFLQEVGITPIKSPDWDDVFQSYSMFM